jgi:hypothetical protein
VNAQNINSVACRLKAVISESERTSVARQRLSHYVSWETNVYVTDHYHGNESLNSGAFAVTDTLAMVGSELRKLKG